MEEEKYLFRSKFNDIFIVLFLATSIVMWVSYMEFPLDGIHFWLFILKGALPNYLMLALFQSHYYFYDEGMVRIFTFRPFFRKKVFMYDKIYKIRYQNGGGKGEYPRFIVFQKKKQYYKFFNGFLFNKRGRVQIVEFLLSKNIQMEVISHNVKEDREIINMIKKKYPKNIRLDPMLPKSYQERILK